MEAKCYGKGQTTNQKSDASLIATREIKST